MSEEESSEISTVVSNAVFSELVNEDFNEMFKFEMPSVLTNELSNELSNGLPNVLSNELSNELSSELSNELPNEMSNGLSGELYNELPNQVTNQVSNEITKEVPKEVSNKVSKEKSREVYRSHIYLSLRHSTKEIGKRLVIGVSQFLSGPFYRFEEEDQDPDVHQLFTKQIKSARFKFLSNLRCEFYCPQEKEIYFDENGAFRFNNKHLEVVKPGDKDFTLGKHLNRVGCLW